jgi:AP-1 complex subunit gamma-1
LFLKNLYISFQTFNLELFPPSNTTIPSNNSGDVRQTIKISNPNKDKLRMRIKLNYSYNDSPMSDEAELNTFPEQCYN